MVQQKTIGSIVGMVIGLAVVTGLAMAGGLTLLPALALGLIGLFLGGWIVERWVYGYETGETTDEGHTPPSGGGAGSA